MLNKSPTTSNRCPVCNKSYIGIIPYVGGGKLFVHKEAKPVKIGGAIPYPAGCFWMPKEKED